MVKECTAQVQHVDDIFEHIVPTAKDSPWQRKKKALLSVRQESKMIKIEEELRTNLEILDLYQGSVPNQEIQNPFQPVFLVKFERDKNFIGRKAVIEEISLKFQSQRRVAISGFGGVG